MARLQQQGWRPGLRLDPLIYQTGYAAQYERLFEQIFAVIDPQRLHSVSLGPSRPGAADDRILSRIAVETHPAAHLFSLYDSTSLVLSLTLSHRIFSNKPRRLYRFGPLLQSLPATLHETRSFRVSFTAAVGQKQT